MFRFRVHFKILLFFAKLGLQMLFNMLLDIVYLLCNYN